jgi:nucleotide-binding universal stress UspA family protein
VTRPLYPKVVAGYEENERGEDARALAELVADRDGGELNVLHVERGSPAKALGELAERGEADLIVLGSTHHAGFGSMAPGSVAEHLLKGARCRLLIAPKGFAQARDLLAAEGRGEKVDSRDALPWLRDELRVVAVGYDGGRESRAALAEAAVLAARFGASLRVISVGMFGPSAKPGVVEWDLQSQLLDAVAELPAALRALPQYETGDPVQRLVEHTGEGIDLLVLGSRGYGPLMRLIAGSVSVQVIRAARCPVLLVPRPAADA